MNKERLRQSNWRDNIESLQSELQPIRITTEIINGKIVQVFTYPAGYAYGYQEFC